MRKNAGRIQVAFVADAVHRARGGELRRAGHGRGRGRTAPVGRQVAAAETETSGRRVHGQRGQAAPPTLLPGGRLGLGGGRLRVHGASAQPRAAVVVRRAREARDPRLSRRRLRQNRSVLPRLLGGVRFVDPTVSSIFISQ